MGKDIIYMKEALAEARKALRKGEVPVGCVIVLDDKVIGRGHNQVEAKHSCVEHAEIIAIKNANKNIREWRLENAEVFVTLEPCPMCATALILARVRRIVYGAKNTELGACGTKLNLPDEPIFNHHPFVKGEVLADECAKILNEFFSGKRTTRL